ncbi:MAG: hypothetical protein GXP52_04450 [Deltaproteobacteria bacterium]|nr:hypothetical protein [Deltaproteobacteria bacterium]
MEIQRVFEVPKSQSTQGRDKDVEMMARSFYRLLRKNGYTQNQVISVAGYILDGLIREFETDASSDVQQPEDQPQMLQSVI